MQDYHNLVVWRKAHELALRTTDLTLAASKQDHTGVLNQARRAALSIPCNVAEGCGRATHREFAQFLQIAVGSTTELEYQLEFAADSGVVLRSDAEPLQQQAIEVRRMLYGLLKRVRREK